jgi:hypothetical protein
VYEDTIYQLKRINNQLVSTLGRVQFGNKIILEGFQIAHSTFPIPNDGILSRRFMVDNVIIVNYQTNKVIFQVPDKLEILLEPLL